MTQPISNIFSNYIQNYIDQEITTATLKVALYVFFINHPSYLENPTTDDMKLFHSIHVSMLKNTFPDETTVKIIKTANICLELTITTPFSDYIASLIGEELTGYDMRIVLSNFLCSYPSYTNKATTDDMKLFHSICTPMVMDTLPNDITIKVQETANNRWELICSTPFSDYMASYVDQEKKAKDLREMICDFLKKYPSYKLSKDTLNYLSTKDHISFRFFSLILALESLKIPDDTTFKIHKAENGLFALERMPLISTKR